MRRSRTSKPAASPPGSSSSCSPGGRSVGGRRRGGPRREGRRLLRAAGVGAAVAAGVAGAGPDHPAPAPGALDRVLPRVEERGLARRGRLGRRRRGCLTGGVGGSEPCLHLGRQDPGLLLLVGGQELL